MQLVDVLAILLLGAGVAAFFLGESALARSEDLAALYWLAVGVTSLRAAVQISRPVSRT